MRASENLALAQILTNGREVEEDRKTAQSSCLPGRSILLTVLSSTGLSLFTYVVQIMAIMDGDLRNLEDVY